MAGGSKIWTVRGIPSDLQTAVSAAAKAARQTLGEWTASALTSALAGEIREEGTSQTDSPPSAGSPRLDGLEARLGTLERRLDSLENRSGGTQVRVDGLQQRADGTDNRLTTLIQRLDALESRNLRPPTPANASATPPNAAARSVFDDPDAPQGPFTRGIGSRKRLTAAGEEELQRLLAAGVDDAAIAARLGIHKRIVWARRLTESGLD